MPTVTVPGVTQSKTARPIVQALVNGTRGAERAALMRVLAESAASDGNRHLDAVEAHIVRDAYEGSRLGGQVDLGLFEARASELLRARLASRDLDGIHPYFTATTRDINQIIIREMRDVVAAAGGKPVDFNVMVFSFVDPEIGAAILDMAQQHPNVSFRIIADFGQLSETGNRQPPLLARRAAELGLDNIGVKFKKDSPYAWSERAGRPVYMHNATKGLNHHKGFVASIDGVPVKMVTGSYNWSPTADDKNYEDLFVIDRSNPANRPVLAAYQAEFVAFYNHADALNLEQAKRHKAELFNRLRVENGRPAEPLGPVPEADPPYVPRLPGRRVDVNSLDDESYQKLRGLIGNSRTLGTLVRNLTSYGRFSSMENLLDRVPSVGKLTEARREALADALEFGDGRVLINVRSAAELERALRIPHNLAVAIVAARTRAGDFESVEELRAVPGMTEAIFNRIAPRINDDVARMYFSARPYGADAAARGYAAENHERKVPVMGAGGVVAEEDASLAAGVTDLMRRAQPGDIARIAMYSMGVNTPEFAAIAAAARRGVHVKVVLNDDYNEVTAAALQAIAGEGHPLEVRIQKARTMHEKFGVVNDDFFFGTANASTSSTTKHSEDRIVVKNNAEVAAKFVEDFELIWARSRPFVA